MTNQSHFATTLLAVAAVTVVAMLSLGVHRNSCIYRDDNTKLKAEEDREEKSNSNVNEGGEVRDSTEETASAAAQREKHEKGTKDYNASKLIESPPSTPVKTTTAKGKKWRDRLSAKKQLKLKQHQKNRSTELRNDGVRTE
mmetsp:Transcript_13815/g.34712  ORF Transcript_13815/g.34712 Transcript_13815/m.34712 type:complete len:141 (-) Transcript_13815:419-841(-)|eukprot:CAMPEP_0116101154 /NCGR_PEP_ID=MMETSP0327-20121206/12662_1 /TAXON_ID=44447 /ORGANISM="Pseudo-nitzschia delicatissima, Strain B596" /LENGTH=140 /DNA_ID=CAMNT_0003593103 /DNA_START=111 /DNA_END=533 /DNA_ORIENTATION=+